MQQYWKFYWPLALTGLAMLLARQMQNGTLARYPEAAHELAVFAMGSSIFFLFNSALIFVPQMANLLDRSPHAHRVCLRFTLLIAGILFLLLSLLGSTGPGKHLVGILFPVKTENLLSVLRYIRYLSPLILLNGLRFYYTGLLIQARQTGKVTLLNIFYLFLVTVLLTTGFQRGWDPVVNLTLAQVLPALFHLLFTYLIYRRFYTLPPFPKEDLLTIGKALEFFAPVALTSVLFAMSRPIIYSFVSHQTNSEVMIAALRVGFDFSMIFRNPLNQFRNLIVTFGRENLPGLRKFMILVVLSLTGIMVLVAATPLITLFLKELLGVTGEVLRLSKAVFWVLCLLPVVAGIRNYFHGTSMIQRRTRGMGAGAILRLIVIYSLAWSFASAGELNHVMATFVLLSGFLTETIVIVLYQKLYGKKSGGGKDG